MTQADQGPDLEHYSGDGEDLTHEQREYLNTYAQHVTEHGDHHAEHGQGDLSDNAQGEWA